MSKLFDWLRVEPEGTVLWKFLVKMVFGMFAFAIVAGIVVDIAEVKIPDRVFEAFIRDHTLIFFLAILPFFAAIEEVIFRLPLVLFLKFNAPPTLLCIAAIVLSVVFGLAHGGWIGVPLQGIMGVAFSVIFLKCGGMQKKYGKAFLSSTGVHFAHNFIAFGVGTFFGS